MLFVNEHIPSALSEHYFCWGLMVLYFRWLRLTYQCVWPSFVTQTQLLNKLYVIDLSCTLKLLITPTKFRVFTQISFSTISDPNCFSNLNILIPQI